MTTPKKKALQEEETSTVSKPKSRAAASAKGRTATADRDEAAGAEVAKTGIAGDPKTDGVGKARRTSKPRAGSVAKSAAQSTVQSTTRSTARPTTRSTTKSTAKPTAKSASGQSRRKVSATAAQRATTRRRKVVQEVIQKGAVDDRSTPTWLRYTLAVVVVIVFSVAFYYLCIQPYAYRWKPCYGQKGYGVCVPVGYGVHGIDISHYQGDINWTALTADDGRPFPLSFIFMKATEGRNHVDNRFADNFRQAHERGLIRGAYHYFRPQTDAMQQAEAFIRTVSLEPGDLPPVLDVETTGRCSDEELQQAVGVWMSRVEQHYGVRPILYTSYKFKTKHLNTPDLDGYPYWIAHYYVDSVRYQGSWQFWQYTDVGQVPGIRESVDLNVFHGTLEELRALTLPDGIGSH